MGLVETIQILYICSTGVAVLATIPQLRKLVIVKSSQEFSLGSYAMWGCTQSVALMYMVSINNPILVATNAIWVIYYMAMVSLIVYYRQPQRVSVELEVEEPVVLVSEENLAQPATANVQ